MQGLKRTPTSSCVAVLLQVFGLRKLEKELEFKRFCLGNKIGIKGFSLGKQEKEVIDGGKS